MSALSSESETTNALACAAHESSRLLDCRSTSKTTLRFLPLSTTLVTSVRLVEQYPSAITRHAPGMVTEVSQMSVDKMIRLTPSAGGSKMACCSASGTVECMTQISKRDASS